MRTHHFVGQFADRTGGDTPAFVENAELARHAPGEWQFLLDQQHGKPLFLVQLPNDVADFVDDVRLNPFSRLVKNQQLRFEHEGAADRELLLLPTRKIAAAPVQHLLQHGKQVEDTGWNGTGAVPADTQPDTQIFLHRQMRKNLAALWHVTDATPSPLLGWAPDQIAPRACDLTGARRL